MAPGAAESVGLGRREEERALREKWRGKEFGDGEDFDLDKFRYDRVLVVADAEILATSS